MPQDDNDKVVNFFQICHTMDQLLHEQHQLEAAAKKNARRLTKRGTTRNMPLFERTILQAPTMIGQINMVVKKTSVTTAKPKAFMLHGFPAIVITADTPNIVSPLALLLVEIETNPLGIVTNIAIHTIAIVLILVATLVINMIAGNTIASQLPVTARANVTMQNTKANLDQDHDHNQGPILVILEA